MPSKRVALVGNPNAGKSTIFNSLTGLRQKVANYPGVTVERCEGTITGDHEQVTVIDLPGSYSLNAHSADEEMARDYLLGALGHEKDVDCVVVVIDASNLRRHLYFATQVIDLGYKVVLCCNMMDEAERNGQVIDLKLLEERLSVPVIATVGHKRQGISELRSLLLDHGPQRMGHKSQLTLPKDMQAGIDSLAETVARLNIGKSQHDREWATYLLSIKDAGLDMDNALSQQLVESMNRVGRTLGELGHKSPATTIAQARYQHIDKLLDGVINRMQDDRRHITDRLDRLLTHPILGLATFAALMFVVFLSIFSWASPLMDGIESVLGWLADTTTSSMADGLVKSLIVDGAFAGVGAVVVFLPQICILFLFICILEDSGYMARAAMVMHRIMRAIGLPGKSFIPLLSCFACAIPGIMAARTIENQRDRLVTILIAPLMTCSARIPVYTILIAILFSSAWVQAAAMLLMYLLGMLMALLVAWVLKKTTLKQRNGLSLNLLIELPPYRIPQLRHVMMTMWHRSVLFLKDAGTIIFVSSIVLWAMAYFPQADPAAAERDPGHQIKQSIMGQLGQGIEPVIKPLGFDWKMGVGLIASFAAREVFVSTMGVVYGIGDDADESSESLRERMANDTWPDGSPLFSPLSGLSLMVFYALACQCVSTLGVVRRETHGWKWPLFMFTYMTALAYVCALLVYQVGSFLNLGIS